MVNTALKDQNETVRELALDVLFSRAADAKDAMPAVVSVLANEKRSPADRTGAAKVLESLGVEGRPAVPMLLRVLRELGADYGFRQTVVLALARAKDGAAIPALIEMLTDIGNSAELRNDAATALGSFTREATGGLPALASILKEKNNDVVLRLRECSSTYR